MRKKREIITVEGVALFILGGSMGVLIEYLRRGQYDQIGGALIITVIVLAFLYKSYKQYNK